MYVRTAYKLKCQPPYLPGGQVSGMQGGNDATASIPSEYSMIHVIHKELCVYILRSFTLFHLFDIAQQELRICHADRMAGAGRGLHAICNMIR